MRDFYMTLDATPKMKDGDTSYPRPGYDKSIGMSVEFRCVTSVFFFLFPFTNQALIQKCLVQLPIHKD